MNRITQKLRGTTIQMVWLQIAVLLLASLVPAVITTKRADAAQLLNRELKLSSSAAGTLTDGQDVTYEFHFDYASTSNVGSVEFDFCSNTPIIGDSCTAPTGFDVNEGGGLSLDNQTNETGFTIHANTDTNTICITRTAEAVTASVDSEYEFSGIDNPDATNTSFYARLRTRASTDCTGAETDSGGIAVSTANQLTITAKVQESLTFCIYTGANCAAGGSSITIGDSNGVLSTTDDYHNADADFDVATNASAGVIIRMKGDTLCKSAGACGVSSNTISAIGASAAATSIGSEQFGMCVSPSGGSVTAAAPYNHASCGDDVTSGTYSGSGQFAFDTNTTDGTGSTFGDTIASSTGASTTTVGTLNFLANVSNTTEPGIYTSTLTFIATGTF